MTRHRHVAGRCYNNSVYWDKHTTPSAAAIVSRDESFRVQA